MMKVFKGVSLVAVLIGAMFIAGCGGSSGFDTATSQGNGVAQDGYIAKGTVFLDVNENNKLDAGEPSVETGMDGKYSDLPLTDAQKASEAPLILKGGYDKASWVTLSDDDVDKGKTVLNKDGEILDTPLAEGYSKFRGIFKAPAPEDGDYSNVVLSPVTTMIHQYKKNNPGKSTNQAKEDIAKKLGVSNDDVDLLKDDVIAKSKTSQKAQEINKFNAIVASSVKVASDVAKSENEADSEDTVFEDVTKDFFTKMADSDLTDDTDLNTAVAASMDSALEGKADPAKVTKAKSIINQISSKIQNATDNDKVYNEIALAISVIETKSSEIQEGDVDDTNIEQIILDVEEGVVKNADASGTEVTGTVKGFALKNNLFNGVDVSKSGNLLDDNYADLGTNVSFTLVNYTGKSLDQTATASVAIEAVNGEQDLRSIQLDIPVKLKASSDQAADVTLSVAKDAKIKAEGEDVDGNVVTINDLTNDSADTLTGTDGSVTINLNDWVERFKSEISNSGSEALQTFTLQGTFKVSLSITTEPEIVFGYAKEGSITNKFSAVYGYIDFQ